jgi:hypothetical protein
VLRFCAEKRIVENTVEGHITIFSAYVEYGGGGGAVSAEWCSEGNI